eukprot:CAMPEP_0170512984 /NCGR_PEP_ID=MMETSP0208-20121228/67150_1 /TAXON_ID=197538 /ORGANISM="Strombidium inclinatum, Strain S3" /LENGTH=68 /DNA_ID=CAMNT_0010796669 /DNA_START=3296 /DNA_END=3502 /DNA_ORIENTATION=+
MKNGPEGFLRLKTTSEPEHPVMRVTSKFKSLKNTHEHNSDSKNEDVVHEVDSSSSISQHNSPTSKELN